MNAQKANNTIDKVRQLQRKLYLTAKANSKRRFHALYDKIYRMDILTEAWKRVKANKGAGGFDNVSIDDVEAYGVEKLLVEIQDELQNSNYHPKPVLRCHIPKNDGKGGKRPLGIPVIKDRIVQMAAKIVIEPIFESDFLDCSCGFRPKKSAHDALHTIWKEAETGNCLWVVDADIKDYFGSINQDKLMILLEQRISDRRVLKLIRKWLKAGIMEDGSYFESEVGSPQGGVISPLLSNVYLHYFDRIWEKKFSHLGKLVRYADDFVVMCKRMQNAKEALEAVKRVMAKLELTLHTEKTRLADLYNGKEGFDFLGFHHRWKKGRTKTWKTFWTLHQFPSEKSVAKMHRNIKEVFASRAKLLWSLEDMINLINPKTVGMRNYYNLRFSYRQLAKIDCYITKKFTIWYSKKKQKQHHCKYMTHVSNLLKKHGLKQLAVQ